MSYSNRIIRRMCPLSAHAANTIIRTPLAALALFCAMLGVSPQAAAQTLPTACGDSIVLSANQWRMVGIPCALAPTRRTIGAAFGSSLGVLNYGVTWIAWRRVYDDPSQCAVASGPADCYVKLTLNSPVEAGDAFWIYTTVGATLQLPSTSRALPGPSFSFPATLSDDGNSRFYMFANPYNTTVSWPAFKFTGYVFDIYPFDVTTDVAVAASIVSEYVYYWNGSTYYTRGLGDGPVPAATIAPKEAVWLEMLQPISWVTSGVTVSVLKP